MRSADRSASCSCPTSNASRRCRARCKPGFGGARQPRLERADHRVPHRQPHALDRRARAHDDRHRPQLRATARESSRFRRPARGGGNAQPIDVTVHRRRAANPTPTPRKVLGALEDTPGTANVNSSARAASRRRSTSSSTATARARSTSNIGSAALAVRAAFGGTLATQFDTDNGTKYVQVLYPMRRSDEPQDAASRSRCARAPARSSTSATSPILQNAPAQALITRVNRQTVIHLGANVAARRTRSRTVQTRLPRARARRCICRTQSSSARPPAATQQNLSLTRSTAWAWR